ncbi:MAG TPA: GTPase HflX [Candidatus Salinicoccus stercoripullorum]|uniref:GTPase HflX n=1 Tax=Candidatus Salinicoccus stercoripullorum TaxID=2838756 RepID=A0A9D1QFY5_9STAP|nr:GTPase HflX [Candidatus Salinicoccus stercoripullorum]
MTETFKGIIIAVNTPERKNIESEVNELVNLAESIGVDITGVHVQNRATMDPRSYAGSGFLNEIDLQYEKGSLDYVIVNDEITASQNRAVEEVMDTRIIDRTQVILDIFSLRAHSKAGQLQVELAQLQYLVPRLRGQGINLSRLGAGIGTRGPGETKLETDRRHINQRIKEIRKQLKVIESHRERYREKRNRNQVVKISLIGYTNAGKSSLFNTMAQSDTLEEDALFATLDPKTRRLILPSGFECVISDTVGFIQNLPTTLVESFKSTLEEAADSDFLIHVIDNTAEDLGTHYDTVKSLVRQLDMESIPSVVFFNKTDIDDGRHYTPSETHEYVHKDMAPGHINTLLEEFMKKHMEPYQVELPLAETQKLYDLKRHTIVEKEALHEEVEEYHIEGYEPEGSWSKRIVERNGE